MARGKLGKLVKAIGKASESSKPEGPSAASHGKASSIGKRKQVSENQKNPVKRPHHAHASQHPASRQQPNSETQFEDSLALEGDNTAYEALVGLLRKSGGQFAAELRRQRWEQDGDSEGDSESAASGEPDGDASMSDGEDGSLKGSELDEGLEGESLDGSDQELDDLDEFEAGESGDEGEDDADDAADLAAKDVAEEDAAADGSKQRGKGAGSASAAESKGRHVDDAAPGVQAEEPDAGRAAAGPAPADTWAQHVEHVLTDTDASALQAGPGRTKYKDAEHPADYKGAFPGDQWQAFGREASLPPAPSSLTELSVRDRLVARWREVHQEEQALQARAAEGSTNPASTSGRGKPSKSGSSKGTSKAQEQGQGDFASAEQRVLFSLLHSYSDVMLPARPYPTDLKESDPYLDAYLLHILNHVAKTADRIKKNNDKLEAARKADQAAGGKGGVAVGEVPRDQGFTRPKALLLLPQRNLAFKAVRRLVALALKETRADSVQGKEKLVEQFTDAENEEAEMDAAARARREAKPQEYRALFSGNLDDHFRLGVKITRGAIRLFSDLMQSDVIIASPIALATKIAEERRGAKQAGASGGKDAVQASSASAGLDFLSSIEILVVDRADMLAMQNWQHVETVVDYLNKLPREQHGTDIMRVREWALSGWSAHYRQTVLLSSFAMSDMNALFNGPGCSNYQGRLRLQPQHAGVLAQVVPQVQQVFERFPAPSPAEAPSARLEFFKRAVWPRIKDAASYGTLIVVPTYFDYIRVRNFLTAEDADFAHISEYTAPPDVTAARSRFYHRKKRILVYTERAHFYHRHRIRGIKDVLFYSLPEHPHYYSELVNLLEDVGANAGAAQPSHSTVGAMFCKWDALQLERVVGSGRAKKMISGEAPTYMFC